MRIGKRYLILLSHIGCHKSSFDSLPYCERLLEDQVSLKFLLLCSPSFGVKRSFLTTDYRVKGSRRESLTRISEFCGIQKSLISLLIDQFLDRNDFWAELIYVSFSFSLSERSIFGCLEVESVPLGCRLLPFWQM